MYTDTVSHRELKHPMAHAGYTSAGVWTVRDKRQGETEQEDVRHGYKNQSAHSLTEPQNDNNLFL